MADLNLIRSCEFPGAGVRRLKLLIINYFAGVTREKRCVNVGCPWPVIRNTNILMDREYWWLISSTNSVLQVSLGWQLCFYQCQEDLLSQYRARIVGCLVVISRTGTVMHFRLVALSDDFYMFYAECADYTMLIQTASHLDPWRRIRWQWWGRVPAAYWLWSQPESLWPIWHWHSLLRLEKLQTKINILA